MADTATRETETVYKTSDPRVTYHKQGQSFWIDEGSSRVYLDEVTWTEDVRKYCFIPEEVEKLKKRLAEAADYNSDIDEYNRENEKVRQATYRRDLAADTVITVVFCLIMFGAAFVFMVYVI